MTITVYVAIGLLIRIGLIAYGEWQDRTMVVKYTDIDYFVFHDAAGYVAEGKSPYLRATYRYTPLLSWILQPNIWISPMFGKLLFVILDIYTGFLIYQIVLSRNSGSSKTAQLCAAFWLFNPLPAAVSSRGNAESLMSSLVLLCVQLLIKQQIIFASLMYGTAVHFKIYPVTYALPIYLLLGNRYKKGEAQYPVNFKECIHHAILPSKERAVFVISSLTIFILLTGGCYYLYGWEFLEHTYLYHVTRRDIRHNFSVYFYMLYLQTGDDNSVLTGLVTFIPQVILLLAFSFKFYLDPAFVFFLHTFAFVTFNKVCTSQYFLWYLCLLPLMLPQLTRIIPTKAVILVLLWFTGQGVWLYPAYLLEFQGYNTFIYIWLAGLVFFSINCYILYEILDNYSGVPYINSKEKESINSNIVTKIPSDICSPVKVDNSDKQDISASTPVESNIHRVTRSQTRKRNEIK